MVSVESINRKQEEVEALKAKIAELEEEKRLLNENSQSISTESDSNISIDQSILYAILALSLIHI